MCRPGPVNPNAEYYTYEIRGAIIDRETAIASPAFYISGAAGGVFVHQSPNPFIKIALYLFIGKTIELRISHMGLGSAGLFDEDFRHNQIVATTGRGSFVIQREVHEVLTVWLGTIAFNLGVGGKSSLESANRRTLLIEFID